MRSLRAYKKIWLITLLLLAIFVAGCGNDGETIQFGSNTGGGGGPTPDTTPPSVTQTDPANASAGVGTNKKIAATFSEFMDPATLTNVTFTLLGPGATPVPATVSLLGGIATLAPAGNLAANTAYTATITTGARDLAGNALAANFTWTFTTGAAPDTTAPTVTFIDPAQGATGVASNKKIAATFSESLDPATINNNVFSLTGPGATPVPGTLAFVGLSATFTPTTGLAFNTLYTAKINAGPRDLAGNPLAAYTWTFTTGAAPDTTAPTVTFTAPANAATAVGTNSKVAATFSEGMDPLTITNLAYTVTGPGTTPVPGTVAYAGLIATFTPASNLAFNTVYTATITTAAKDLAGNPLAGNFTWTFTTGVGPDTSIPAVTFTDPTQAAAAVAVNTKIAATFSEAMDPLTVTNLNFSLTGPGVTPVAGTVTYVGLIATFTPSSNLAFSTTYTGSVSTGAKDLAGNALAANYIWSFTTGAAPDTTSPTVTFTDPATAATGVAVNKKIAATFSEGMDPATITNVAFTVTGPGLTPVVGTVTYTGLTATFSPTSSLAFNTAYTATVNTAAKDLAGNALAANYSWTFTTGAAPDTTPPTVTFTDPATAATAVAVNKKIAATFSESMDPTTTTNVTYTLTGPGLTPVAGTVTYIGLIATFTPTNTLAFSTTYTATVKTGATDLAGNGLAANYSWTFTTGAAPDITRPTVTFTDPANAATAVASNKKVSATFSEGMDPTTCTTVTYTLTGPGLTPVAGTVTYTGLIATFTPTNALAFSTTYTATVTTGARDLAGNALAANYAWTFTTGAAPDTTPPTVTLTDPANGATAVAINKKISATFSEGMDPTTTTNITFFPLTGPGATPVAGTVTYIGQTATFTPSSNLAFNTKYTSTVTTGVKDLAGNAMAANYVWSFTTGAAPDTTPPTVTFTDPANAATGVALNKKIAATFSEGMDPTSTTNVTFTLTGPGQTPIPGAVTYVGLIATFTPASTLPGSTNCTATITTGVKDLAGNSMAANFTWTFTTGAAPDTTPPTVVQTVPLNLATDVPLNRPITATFSEGMDPLTISNITFTVAGVPASVTYDGPTKIATLTPSANLVAFTKYTATVSTASKDLAGNPMAANFTWTFTTGQRIVPLPVNLGAIASFGSFGGGAGMTNQGIFTVINGDIGTSGASTMMTGFHDKTGATYTETPLNQGFVNGTVFTATAPPGSTLASQGALDARTAFNNLSPAALPGGIALGTSELGGLTLRPGIYKSESGSYQITGSDLTLDAQGDPNAVWVFQMATSLTVGGPGAAFPRNIILANGALPKNIFWQVGSNATINAGGGGTMVGTIIAEAGVTFSTAGSAIITTLNGRALGLSASVTLVNTVMNIPGP